MKKPSQMSPYWLLRMLALSRLESADLERRLEESKAQQQLFRPELREEMR